MEYGILGDGVNLASRLEELNKRYSTNIIISEDTYRQVALAVKLCTLLLVLRAHMLSLYL